MLSHEQLVFLESQLHLLKGENEKHINQLKENNKQILDDQLTELSTTDNHPGDLGTELFDVERDRALIDTITYEQKKIDDAFLAMHEGTYGICKVCHKEIPYERLQIVPMTSYCVEHAINADVLGDGSSMDLIISKPIIDHREYYTEFSEDFIDPLLEFANGDQSDNNERFMEVLDNSVGVDMEGNITIFKTEELQQYERDLDDDEIDYLYGASVDQSYEDNI